MEIAKIVEAMSEKSQRLKELRAASPEVEEALQLADEYQRLLKELEGQCHPPTVVPMPYPVYPTWLDWRQPYRIDITCGTATIDSAVHHGNN